ncbi:MAG: enoyl-CoA hydratase [Candidatus Eremiobacteraeota bacterium]|nr:enoyl-CoA hydratase [Candidatus Eremiobacteraeota bacterium]MBV8355647.1 enoyl-CoA hydratase [Candidatus Eremiobacteraeota bacterium]
MIAEERTTERQFVRRVELGDGLVELVLDRPEKRNALSLEVMRELIGALDEIGADRNLAVVILRHEGPVFSAGHDLREMLARDVATYREIFDVCTTLMERVQAIPQPVIAQVSGVATAAGCQLVASCDLAIASDDSRFATPGVKIGLFCTTPMVALTRAVGRKHAMEMLLTGEFVDANTAATWGLINRAVPKESLRDETIALARKVADASRFVIGLGKAAFYAQVDLDQPKAYAYAKEVMSMNALAADAQEGMGAFVEKRSAHWNHGRGC